MTPKELVDILTEEDKLEGLKDAQMADINVVQNAIVVHSLRMNYVSC